MSSESTTICCRACRAWGASSRSPCPVIRAFYARLQPEGEPTKVALTACMRNLLTILNAIARDGAPWQLTRSLARA